jgi:hypothetical protein
MRPNPQPLPYKGRGENQSLSPFRREVWREVCLWFIYLKIAVKSLKSPFHNTFDFTAVLGLGKGFSDLHCGCSLYSWK